ncbi:MAG: hypothetical protein A2Z27_04165 [candidate division Zixibacteria bacterium RBG_16_50_21]|nr:MAG: hypothetical protein A2Z27_04165 [candidate division Zixibacteria bacterium RBG_16_50_21]
MKKLTLIGLLVLALAVGANAYTITFSEFAVGTAITTEYLFAGISLFEAPWFSSEPSPSIKTDGANPTSPVLSAATDNGLGGAPWATPSFPYGADIKFTFAGPGTTHFGLDIGYINNLNSTHANVWGVNGNLLFSGSISPNFGINHFQFGIPGTERINYVYLLDVNYTEGAGWAIDNLETTPEPATLMLLGSGLLGMGGISALRYRRRK